MNFPKIAATWADTGGPKQGWVYIFTHDNGLSLTDESSKNKPYEHEVTFVGNIDWSDILAYSHAKKEGASTYFDGPIYIRKNIDIDDKNKIIDFFTDLSRAEIDDRKKRVSP